MRPHVGFLEAALSKALQHVTGSPLTDAQRHVVGERLAKGSVVGLHSADDGGLLLLTREHGRSPYHYRFAVEQFDRQGRLQKGSVSGARGMAVTEFEKRSGQTFGRKDAGPLETREVKVRGAIGNLMKAVQQRHAVNQRPSQDGLR